MKQLDELAVPDLRDRLDGRTRFSDLPDPGPKLPPTTTLARRALVVVVALAIFVVAGGFAWRAFAPAARPPGPLSSDTGTTSYVNPMGIQITLDYPSSWYARSVSQDGNLDPAQTAPLLVGVVISNTVEAMPSPSTGTPSPGPLPENPDLTSDFVTVTIRAKADAIGSRAEDSVLPLSMDNAKVAPGPENLRILDAVVAGTPIEITLAAGPNYSRADLAAADAIVASIRPTHVESTTPGVSGDPPSEAGYWIRFPDQMDVTDTGFSGSVVADTNLPDGTRYAATYESDSSGSTCCPAVKNGHVRIQLENSTCYGLVGHVGGGPPATVTITVAPHAVSGSMTLPLGDGGGGPDDEQPSNVIDVLGKDFQNLSGDQVRPVPGGVGNELVATRTYSWPEPQCGGTPIPLFGGPDCPAAREQLQGDTLDDAMVEVMGALSQGRMCEFWGTELPPQTEAAHPWDQFSQQWRDWFLNPPKDFPSKRGAWKNSPLDWNVARKDGADYIVDVTDNGTPILELRVAPLPDYCPSCSANTVPFWGVTDWTFLDR